MKKNLVIAVLGLAVILLLASLLKKSFSSGNKEEKTLNPFTESKRDTIYLEKYLNKIDSTTHGKFQEKNQVSEQLIKYVRDTVAPVLGVGTDKIEELTRAKLVLEGKLKESRRELDENKKARVYYENKYLQIIANSDSTINYRYNAIVDIVKYREKKGLFSPEKYYIDISSPDPNFRINGVEHYKKPLNIKAKPWGIGVQGGYYYVPGMNGFYPAFGIGISYNFLRF